MKGQYLEAVITFDDAQRIDRYFLLYTRGDALGERHRADVTVTDISNTPRSAAEGAAAGVIASLLMRVERSAEGSVEVETRPTKK